MSTATIDRDTAFAESIRPYENQWVALIEKDGVRFIVGAGRDAVEAAKDAEVKGYPDASLLKVPSFTLRFIP